MTGGREPLYRPLAASSGAWIALVACALFLLMLAALLGPFEACGGSTGFPPRIGLWLPPSTPAEVVAGAREVWRAAAPADAEWLESASLEDLAERRADVVVLAHARRLTAPEQRSLERHLARGGSAVVVGAIGVRDADDTWLGWDAMRALLRVERVVPLPREQSFFVAVDARGPLTAGAEPGQRMALAAEEGVPALEDPDAPLFWATFTLEPVGRAAAAARAESRGAGRLVWLAVGPESAANAAAVDGLSRTAAAALAWAGRLPFAEVLAWPEGAPFAALLAMDSEWSFENAAAVAEIARRESLPITFLAVSQEAREHPSLAAELARVGEVGSHGDVHEGFEGVLPAEQRARLERSRGELEALGVPPPRGFRPPLLSYDETTLALAAETRFDYVLGNRDFDRLVPTLAGAGNGAGPLVQIARVVRDDVDLIQRERLAAPAAIADAALADAERVARRGGLYYLSFHTQLLATPERIAALPAIARGLREQGAWLARGAELADWWRARHGVSLAWRRAGPRRVALAVGNAGPRASEAVVVRLHLQRPIAAAALRATRVLQGVREGAFGGGPELRLAPGDGWLDLAVPGLAPGERRSWHLDWETAVE